MNYKKTSKLNIFKIVSMLIMFATFFFPSKTGAQYNPADYSDNSYSPSSYYSDNSYTPSSYYSDNSYSPSSYYSDNSYTPSSYYSDNSYSPSSYYSDNSYTPSSYYSDNSYSPSSYYSDNSYTPSSYYSDNSYSPSSYYSDNSYTPSSYYSDNSYSPSSYYSDNSYTPSSYNYDNGSATNGSYQNYLGNGGYGNYGNGGYMTETIVAYGYDNYGYNYGNNNGYYGYGNYAYNNTGCGSNCNTGCGSNCYTNEIPLVVYCDANDNSVDRNDTVTFTANASGGTGNYSYSWSGDVSGSGRTISRSFNTSGRKTALVTVYSNGRTASAQCTVQVDTQNDDLDGTCYATDNEVEEGDTVTWRVNASGGDGDYEYRWSGDVTGDNRTETETYNSSGTKRATVRITSDGESITRTCTVRVVDDNDDNDNLRAVCDVTPDNPEEGDTVTWRVRVSGGDGDYEYRWSGDVTGNNRTETKRYNTSGRKEATVRITSDGETLRKTCTVYVDNDNSSRDRNSNITLSQSTPVPPPGNLASGVFLSDLPYTGASENFKVTLFFVGLALWSMVVAYVFWKRNAEKQTGRKLSHKETIEKFKRENLARKRLT